MDQKILDEFKEMGIEVSALTAEEAESLETIIYCVPKSVTLKKNKPLKGEKNKGQKSR
jgi:hypothetical protein